MEFITFIIMLAVCIIIALFVARYKFNEWRKKDLAERGAAVLDMDEDRGATGQWFPPQMLIKNEIHRQICDLSSWNQEAIFIEEKRKDSILEPVSEGDQMQRFGRILHILSMDMIVFHKRYKHKVIQTLKNSGALSIVCLLCSTITHFAVVVLFVVVTLPVL